MADTGVGRWAACLPSRIRSRVAVGAWTGTSWTTPTDAFPPVTASYPAQPGSGQGSRRTERPNASGGHGDGHDPAASRPPATDLPLATHVAIAPRRARRMATSMATFMAMATATPPPHPRGGAYGWCWPPSSRPLRLAALIGLVVLWPSGSAPAAAAAAATPVHAQVVEARAARCDDAAGGGGGPAAGAAQAAAGAAKASRIGRRRGSGACRRRRDMRRRGKRRRSKRRRGQRGAANAAGARARPTQARPTQARQRRRGQRRRGQRRRGKRRRGKRRRGSPRRRARRVRAGTAAAASRSSSTWPTGRGRAATSSSSCPSNPARRGSALATGGAVLVRRRCRRPGSYQVVDFQRGRSLWWLAGLFAAAVLALGRWRGLAALAALGLSFVVLLVFVLPAILAGHDPLLGGRRRRVPDHVRGALPDARPVGTHVHRGARHPRSASLLIGGLSAAFTAPARLTGLDETTSALIGALGTGVDARGLLLAGVVIGALGVLDDVTVTQTSAVWELRGPTPTLVPAALFSSGDADRARPRGLRGQHAGAGLRGRLAPADADLQCLGRASATS